MRSVGELVFRVQLMFDRVSTKNIQNKSGRI